MAQFPVQYVDSVMEELSIQEDQISQSYYEAMS